MLKKKIANGQLVVLKVTSMTGQFQRLETLDVEQLLDLLIEPNAERMDDLLCFYTEQETVINGERYALVCGEKLIADLIVETAENMREAVDFTGDERLDEQFNNYLELVGGTQ